MSLSACRTDLVRVQPVATSVQSPGQVAVYVAVSDGDKPLTDLGTDDFAVYEDGEKLDSSQVKLSVLNPEPYVEHQALLLIDTSGSDAAALAPAVAAFVRKARDSQAVSVYAFDGSDSIRKISDFPKEVASKEPQTVDLGAKGGDASRNLNGAVLRALDELDGALAKSTKPVHVGTLVVVTRGGDLAGRATDEQLRSRLAQSRAYIYAITIGEGARFEQIGRNGTAQATSAATAQSTLEQAAAATASLQHAHYLLAYCSPARAGQRLLRVEVSRKQGDEKRARTGGAELRFDASGFDAQCDSKAPPRFVVSLLYDEEGPIAASAPVPAETEEQTEAEGEKKTTAQTPIQHHPGAPHPAPAAGAAAPETKPPPPPSKAPEKPSDGFEP